MNIGALNTKSTTHAALKIGTLVNIVGVVGIIGQVAAGISNSPGAIKAIFGDAKGAWLAGVCTLISQGAQYVSAHSPSLSEQGSTPAAAPQPEPRLLAGIPPADAVPVQPVIVNVHTTSPPIITGDVPPQPGPELSQAVEVVQPLPSAGTSPLTPTPEAKT